MALKRTVARLAATWFRSPFRCQRGTERKAFKRSRTSGDFLGAFSRLPVLVCVLFYWFVSRFFSMFFLLCSFRTLTFLFFIFF